MVNNPVIKTLLYESIFDFPLDKEEIWKFLISNHKITRLSFNNFLNNAGILHDSKTGYYYLRGNERIIGERTVKSEISEKKNKIAERAVYLLSLIPTIKFVGISGSLAQYNSDAEDDIDFFVIARKESVWLTRFCAIMLLKINRLYRQRKKHTDRICLNMIIESTAFPKQRRDLYNAFEIAQMRPLFDREGTYKDFIEKNRWIASYLPNAREVLLNTKVKDVKNSSLLFLFNLLLFVKVEALLKLIQKLYMYGKVTSETISDDFLAFHPKDFNGDISKKYANKLTTTRGH